MTWFLGGYGVSMIVAAMFPADPVDGFPPGTLTGPPTSISTTGLIHFVAGSLGLTVIQGLLVLKPPLGLVNTSKFTGPVAVIEIKTV